MKRFVVLMVVCTALVSGVRAQRACNVEASVLGRAWVTSTDKTGLFSMNDKVNKLLGSIGTKRNIPTLHKIFSKTHEQFLHTYVQYAGIERLNAGEYDCLTATSLFADILSKAGYNFSVIETNYHIFIKVSTKQGDAIIETTDAANGFVTDRKEIEERISGYRKNVLASATPDHYRYSFSMYETITPDELAGLLYFNQAVIAFNEGDWVECSEKLALAKQYHDTPRVKELSAILSQSATSR